jgi:xylan 1,4-beta-xylosidase
LLVRRTGYRKNDVLSEYVDMGRPKDLTAAQLSRMRELTQDLPEVDKMVISSSDGTIECAIPINSNDIVLATLTQVRK